MKKEEVLYVVIAVLSVLLLVNFMFDLGYRNVNTNILEEHQDYMEGNFDWINKLYGEVGKLEYKYESEKCILSSLNEENKK